MPMPMLTRANFCTCTHAQFLCMYLCLCPRFYACAMLLLGIAMSWLADITYSDTS
ncbi:hypothetical protein C2G38_2119213 [Gigaspora rosea]|uniref:Uncharacterized protein n=1 Tax=Gigaspora rosea TaxID=44941 RepID=A0A397U8K3_9GLOM|nr:hypothetical protein C2G38_2119213 [Gigaspora rosea]